MLPERLRHSRRILAMRLDNIGDVVMLSAALRELRAAAPGVRIDLLASPAGAGVAPMLPWIDEVWTRSAVWQDASGAMPLDSGGEARFIDELRARAYDAVFIFTSFSQSPWPAAYACYLAGVPERFGESKEFGGSLLTVAAPPLPDSAHQAERNLALLEAAGVDVVRRDLELSVPEQARACATALLARHGIGSEASFVLIAPGASCAARRYDGGRFAEAGRLLAGVTGLQVVVAGAERERALCAAVASQIGPSARAIAGETSVCELAAVIERASVAIVNDSGPMHIADAVRTPAVALYSGTELEEQWRPRSTPVVLLRRETDCSPCHAFTCPYQMQCLDIPPREVAEAALRLLRAPVSRRLTEVAS
jgi:lipopolysaccharide heptosyltransferase II